MKIQITEQDIKNAIAKVLKEYGDPLYMKPKQPVPGVDTLYKMKWDYRFTFGSFKGKTVRDVYNMGYRGKEYIVWAYYNAPNVDFEEDILKTLNMEPIDKPGKDKDLCEKIIKNISGELSQEDTNRMLGRISHKRAVKRHAAENREKAYDARENAKHSNAIMAWKNQGH